MRTLSVGRILFGASALAIAVLVTSCAACKPGKPGPVAKYNLQVNIDGSLKGSSVLVDVVGVTPARLPYWESYSATKYWRDGDDARKDADKKTFNFVSGEALSQTLSISDAQWGRWMGKGVTHLVVFADLPGMHTDKPGTQDARRQILSLDKCSWPAKTTNLVVEVQKSGIDVRTPMR